MITALLAGVLLGHSANTKPIWGVTLDIASDLNDIIPALSGFAARPTARVVFDPSMQPADYLSEVKSISAVADIMGEPVDSFYANQYTASTYGARVAAYMEDMGPLVKIWEIGNEVNGDWTGTSTASSARVSTAFTAAQNLHATTALTLFYSNYYLGTDREMIAWSQKYLSSTVRNGVNYVFVSYYPTSATGPQPAWPTIFANLAATFPNAQVGFGELGLANSNGTLASNTAEKKALIQSYYGMTNPLPGRFVGGYFWWTFHEDAVPLKKTFWPTFYSCIH